MDGFYLEFTVLRHESKLLLVICLLIFVIKIKILLVFIDNTSNLFFRIEIVPKYGGEEMFLVKIYVKKLKQPLLLHVYFSTFSALPVLFQEVSRKERIELHHGKVNRINLDNVSTKSKCLNVKLV